MTDTESNYITEPFRIKMVEKIKQTTKVQRRAILRKAKYNLFKMCYFV